jgi:hypothetical protein
MAPAPPAAPPPPAFAPPTESELDSRERALEESIARGFERVRGVEAELAQLQLDLKVNVAPKRHALEMLRQKLEAQAARVSAARAAAAAADRAAAAAAAVLATEEAAKERLSGELGLLVQQSARGQLDRLEGLSQRLEALGAGLPGGGGDAAAERAAELKADAERLRGALLVQAGGGGAPAGPAEPAAAAGDSEASAPAAAPADPAAAAAAEAARAQARHVPVPGRGRRGGGGGLGAARAAPAREDRDANGTFRGFG